MSFPFALNRVLVGSVIAGFALAASAQTADTSKAPSADASPKAGAAVDSAFSKADTNHDGKLSKEEAAKVPAIASKFDQLDKDKKGYLTAEDFSAAK
jgi:Ca2+-binding EF-hand superfamily protein